MINKSKPTLSSRGLTKFTLCNTWEKKFKGPEVIFNFPIQVVHTDERHVLFFEASKFYEYTLKQDMCFHLSKKYGRCRK